MNSEIKIGFNTIPYKKASTHFETSQLFCLRENRVVPILNKRDILVAISSEIDICTQIFGSHSTFDLRVRFLKVSMEMAAHSLLEGKVKKIFCLKKNGVLEPIFDEDSFFVAVKEGYDFYVQ